MRGPLDRESRERILRTFLEGNSANHTVFLLDYKWDTGDVCLVVREALKRALGAHLSLEEMVDRAVEHEIPRT